MKAYTSLEQSKKLAEILPLETADMYYFLDPTPAGNIYHIVIPQIDFGIKTREPEYDKGDIPCWSLAALINIIKPINENTYTIRGTLDGGATISFDEVTNVMFQEKEIIDACVEMIKKLHELKLL